MTESAAAGSTRIDILWIPLGAGAHAARVSGRIFEGAAAALGGRPRRDLYHSALQVHMGSPTLSVVGVFTPRS